MGPNKEHVSPRKNREARQTLQNNKQRRIVLQNRTSCDEMQKFGIDVFGRDTTCADGAKF